MYWERTSRALIENAGILKVCGVRLYILCHARRTWGGRLERALRAWVDCSGG